MEKIPKFDRAEAKVDYRITRFAKVMDKIERETVWHIKRFESKKDLKQRVIYEDKEARDCFDGQPQFSTIQGNLLLNEGITEMLTLIASTGATKWDSGNAYLGVGTDDTEAAASQTELIGTAVYKAMDGTYPQVSNQTVTWQSTFGSDDANQAWKEYTVSNSNSNSGKNLNRKVDSQGTKQSGQSWQLQCGITFS